MYIIISDHQDSRQKKEAKAVLLSVKFCRGGLEWEGSLYEGGGWQLGGILLWQCIHSVASPCDQQTKLTKEVQLNRTSPTCRPLQYCEESVSCIAIWEGVMTKHILN